MKTIKQVSDEIGISKQKLYRYIKKNHINEVHQSESVMYIDDVLENKLKSHFNKETVSSEAHHDVHQSTSNEASDVDMIQFLKAQLEEKDRQIQSLQESLKNQQILTLQANQKIALLEEKKEQSEEEKETFKKTIFGLYKRVK